MRRWAAQSRRVRALWEFVLETTSMRACRSQNRLAERGRQLPLSVVAPNGRKEAFRNRDR